MKIPIEVRSSGRGGISTQRGTGMKAGRFEARNFDKYQQPLTQAEATAEAVEMLKHLPKQEIGIYRLVAIVRVDVVPAVEEVDVDGD